MISSETKKAKKYTIILGVNDSETMEQKLDTERVIRVVDNCCKQYGLCYSAYTQYGSYIHEDGRYVSEKSIVISFVDQDKYLVDEFAKDICCFIHQESVIVTEEDICYHFVSEKI